MDAKLGEVVPKSHHQATTEERLRMSCSHDETKRRFSLRCDAAHPVVAALDYDVVKPGVWDLKYTQVSPEFQHHGVADEIVIRALEFAKANNIKVTCSCSYISDTFMARHPEWSDIRANAEMEGGKAATSKMAQSTPERLQYDERMKKENNAADPKFTKTKQETRKSGNTDESGSASSEKVAENAKSSKSMGKAEEQPETAARELNEAMKKNNERGFRGYA